MASADFFRTKQKDDTVFCNLYSVRSISLEENAERLQILAQQGIVIDTRETKKYDDNDNLITDVLIRVRFKDLIRAAELCGIVPGERPPQQDTLFDMFSLD